MALSRELRIDPSDIKLLRVFRKVVECGGFSQAQAELNVSAPTISTQMATLEARLGMRLCDRGRAGFRLTEKGHRVYLAAVRLEEAIDGFRSDVGELRGKLIGELHVGVVDSLATHDGARLHDAIARFAARDHNVHLLLHVHEPSMLERELLEGRLHVGIAAYYHHVPNLEYREIFTEEHSLYCGRGHPLYPRAPNNIAPEDVTQSHYVLRGYMGHFHAAPVTRLNIAATAYNMEAILMMVRSGAYIGHLPKHYAEPWLRRDELRPLLPEIFDFQSTFELATRRSAGSVRLIKAFIEDLQASLSSAVT